MNSNKINFSGGGCGDSGAEFTMPESEEDERSSHSQPQTRRNIDSNLLKEPWVPAPAKSTKIRIGRSSYTDVINSPTRIDDSEKNDNPIKENQHKNRKSTGKLSSKKKESNKYTKSVVRPGRSKHKRSKSVAETKMSGFTLQTKDSLVDVTVCLSKRREEVLQLWEKNLLTSDTALLNELENANLLAVEASKDVTQLRDSIDILKKKSEKLSEEDSKSLDVLRNRILSKLQLFEKSHDFIQKNLQKKKSRDRDSSAFGTSRETSVNTIDRATQSQSQISIGSMSVKSNHSANLVPPAHQSSSLIYLKEKVTSFSDSDTDDEIDITEFDNPIPTILEVVENGGSESLVELNPSPKFDLVSTKLATSKNDKDTDKTAQLIILKPSRSRSRSRTSERRTPTITIDGIYYRDKIRGLHKKLMDQESKCFEMKREIQRIESQNEFDIKLLKSNMKSQMDDFGHIPEILEFTEDRLSESLHAKFAIEASLQMKVNELNMMKAEISRLGKDLEMSQAKLLAMESKNEVLSEKFERLEIENKELRMELSGRNQLLAQLEMNTTAGLKLNAQNHSNRLDKDSRQLLILEDKITELESELDNAKKETYAMKRAKNEVSVHMTRRIDELMDTLDATRARNRSLQSQINLVKSRYYQLFLPHAESNQTIFPETFKVVADAKLDNLDESP